MHNCRHCAEPLDRVLIDLGHQPPSNAYLAPEALEQAETTYPMRVFVCENCWLAQLPSHATAEELFTEDYAYFSSMSDSWLNHARIYVDAMAQRFGLTHEHLVVEIASNDGYLLQYAKAIGLRVLGVEPTAAAAAAAREKNVETVEFFFGAETAKQLVSEYGHATLMPANNVLAHVPDINDFVAGFAVMLEREGIATFEFPHLLSLLEGLQFDTIYHEHYSYLSLTSVSRIMEAAGLRVFDIEELSTHGGSLRVFVCQEAASYQATKKVGEFLGREESAGLTTPVAYERLQTAAERIKDDLLQFLIGEKRAGRTVAAYGAAAKGNTLLNFAGVRSDLIPFVCDLAPLKQGRHLPGSHIPIRPPEVLDETKPETVLILPWNIAPEITKSMAHVRDWGGRFATAVPKLQSL